MQGMDIHCVQPVQLQGVTPHRVHFAHVQGVTPQVPHAHVQGFLLHVPHAQVHGFALHVPQVHVHIFGCLLHTVQFEHLHLSNITLLQDGQLPHWQPILTLLHNLQ